MVPDVDVPVVQADQHPRLLRMEVHALDPVRAGQELPLEGSRNIDTLQTLFLFKAHHSKTRSVIRIQTLGCVLCIDRLVSRSPHLHIQSERHGSGWLALSLGAPLILCDVDRFFHACAVEEWPKVKAGILVTGSARTWTNRRCV